MDFRHIGFLHFNVRFKGPFDYQVICSNSPDGICVANIYVEDGGDYHILYSLNDEDNIQDVKINIPPIKTKPANDLTDYICVDKKCRIKVPLRLYYQKEDQDNYYPVYYTAKENKIGSYIRSSQNQRKITTIESCDGYFYYVIYC